MSLPPAGPTTGANARSSSLSKTAINAPATAIALSSSTPLNAVVPTLTPFTPSGSSNFLSITLVTSSRVHSGLSSQVKTSPTKAQHSRVAQPQRDTSSGLSTASAIGIGIGISLFVVAVLCGLGFFCYRLHKKRKQETRASSDERRRSGRDARGEIGGAKMRRNDTVGSKAGVAGMPYELSGKSRAGELETKANRHELDAHRQERRYELPDER